MWHKYLIQIQLIPGRIMYMYITYKIINKILSFITNHIR